MKIRLGEMSRRLTVLLVNEKILGRKQQLLEDREVFLKKVGEAKRGGLG